MKDECKIDIYLTKDTVEEVVLFEDSYPNLYKIFKECATLILDMTEEDLDKSLENLNSDFANFCNAFNIKTIARKSIIDILINNTDEITKRCRSLIFMDVDESTSKKFQDELGVMVLSKRNLNDKVFDNVFWRHSFSKNDIIEGPPATEWINLLNDIKWLPMNSLIITDDYLFSESKLSVPECAENVKGLLDAILPKTLAVDFHILILASHPKNYDKSKRNNLVGQIMSYIRSKRSYNIIIEFIFHDAIHQRKIITNYNVMVGDKGFSNFSKHNKVIDDNSTYSCSGFQNIANSIGDTEYGMATLDLKKISKIAEDVKLMHNNNVNDYTKCIVGDCQKDKKINNRMIQTIAQ